MRMTQQAREIVHEYVYVYVCDQHDEYIVVVSKRAVGESCPECKKKIEQAGWIEHTKEEGTDT